MKSAGWRLTTDRWALVVLFIVASCVILSSLSRSMLQFAAPPVHHLSAFMYDDSYRHMQIMETQQVNIRLPYERGDGMKELSVQRFKQFLLTLRLVLLQPCSRFFLLFGKFKVKPEQQLKSRRETWVEVRGAALCHHINEKLQSETFLHSQFDFKETFWKWIL